MPDRCAFTIAFGPHLTAGYKDMALHLIAEKEPSVYIHVADREAQYKEVFAYDFSGWPQLICVGG